MESKARILKPWLAVLLRCPFILFKWMPSLTVALCSLLDRWTISKLCQLPPAGFGELPS